MKILNCASLLRLQAPNLCEKFKDDEILTLSALQDEGYENLIKCEIGAQGYILALLCMSLPNLNATQKAFFEDLDDAFMSAESNVGDEEIEVLSEFLSGCEILIIDDALIDTHSDKENIQTFLSLLQDEYKFKILRLNGEEFCPQKQELTELKELENFDGAVVFKHSLDDKFVGGAYFSMVAKIKDGDMCEISTPNFSVKRKFELDANLKGTVARLGFGGENFSGYDFEIAKISRV
ncbi:MAG: hypothetical protein J6M14_03245 [Campylobacter sp.]|nr:hypothetical protein [Campylobacter sp.]